IKIAATILELDKKNFKKLVEFSLEESVKIEWDNTLEDTKGNILTGDLKGATAHWLGRLIKIHFIGDGYFEGSRAEKSGVATEVAAPMFFAKICSPSREMLIQSYKVPEGQLDLVENQASRGKEGSKIVTPTPGVPEEPFPDGDHGGLRPKLEHINLDKQQDQQGFHPKDLDEQMQDPLKKPLQEELSDEPIPEPMKASKTAIAGLAEQNDMYLPIARRNVMN
ncbi:UNVERIFIED_CONTAM: hypothetical protein Sindi_0716100, partial [Sesamum indicum]